MVAKGIAAGKSGCQLRLPLEGLAKRTVLEGNAPNTETWEREMP